ncbi:MAG: energy transducer TonB [Alcanivorax sp.]|nr:energy transducer TonB [Alcanivorax sp.]
MSERQRQVLAWLIAVAAHAVLLTLIAPRLMTLSTLPPADTRQVTLDVSAPPASSAPQVTTPPSPTPPPARPARSPATGPEPSATPQRKATPAPVAPVAIDNHNAASTQRNGKPRDLPPSNEASRTATTTDERPPAQRADDGPVRDHYLAGVREQIERHKRYPRRARLRHQQGVVTLRFAINADGRSDRVEVISSSGSHLLDQAAKRLLQQLRFPAPPAELAVPFSVTVPLSYTLDQR